MLGKFIIVDGIQWPNPVTGTYAPALNPSEKTYETESGKIGSNVIRLDRFSFDAQFNTSSHWRDIIMAKCKTASCTVTIEGVSYTGRMRLAGSLTMAPKTERTKGTNGLWTVPVRFEET